MVNRRLLIGAAAWCMLSCAYLLQRRQHRRRRVGKSNFYRSRKTLGAYTTLVPHLRRNPQMHLSYFGMSAERLEELLGIIAPHMQRHSFNAPLSPDERLCITLRYLSSGMTMTALSLDYRVSKNTVSSSIREVCHLLWNHLFPRYLATPKLRKWTQISADMLRQWGTPNCLGALGGRHVKTHGTALGMVLLATCDASKCFTMIDVVCHGHDGEISIFGASLIGSKLRNGTMDLPVPKPLPGSERVMPYYFAAETFPLMPNIMRHYPKNKVTSPQMHSFNYRLSRASGLIDNAFGILAARWLVYQTPIQAGLDTIEAILKGTCALHNFMMVEEMALPGHERTYCPPAYTDQEVDGTFVRGEWHDAVNPDCALQPIRRGGSNNYAKVAEWYRSVLLNYFTADETVPRQGEGPDAGSD